MPQFFIERPIFAWVVALFITLAGLLAIPNLPVAQYPEVAAPSVTITATYPGASAQDVSEQVTSIIEDELPGAKNLLYFESVADSFGQSETTVTFQPGTDPDMAQVDVQNRVSNVSASLPTAVMEQGLRFEQSSASFLLIAALYSEDGRLDAVDLADYITRNLKNSVSRVPGVGKFQLFAAQRAMRVWLDPAKLTGLNISVNELNQAIRQQNVVVPSGSLGAPPVASDQSTTSIVMVSGQLKTPEEFGNILLRANPDGTTVRLRDVARIELGQDSYQFASRLNGKAAAAFAIQLTPDGNALETAQGVRKVLEEMAPFFPDGVKYEIPYNTAPYVQASIQKVIETLFEALVLVFLVMFLFLQNVRYTLIPALVVPVAILGTFSVMLFLGYSINVLTMFAMVLAIGILVDDAIVVVENVERIMAEEGISPKEATKKAMPQISGAIVGITLVLTTVFLPLGFMSGSVGVIYRQFAVAMAVSILFSAFMALSFTPALCVTLLKPIKGDHQAEKKGFFGWFNRHFDNLTHHYERGVGKILTWKGRMMVLFLILVVLMGWMFMRLPTSFLPQEDQGFVITNIELPAGASTNRTNEVIKEVEDYFQANPYVENMVTVRGFSFNGSGYNAAIAFVVLKDFKDRKAPDASAEAIAGASMGKLLMGIPDALVVTVNLPAIPSLGNASGFDFRLMDVSSQGTAALNAAAAQMLGLAAGSDKLSQVRITGLGPGAQLTLTVDRVKAAAQGVDFSEVAGLISTSLGSSYLGKFPDAGRMQNVWVQADTAYRMELDEILKLSARNQKGEMVPLSTFISYEWSKGPVQLVRYNSFPAVRIEGSAAEGYSSGDAMTEMENLMKQLPDGFSYAWNGLSYQEQEAGNQTFILMGLALLVVFMVLAALYESWAIPLSVMLVVPLGVLGSVLLVGAMGMANDVYFHVGVITVIGLSAKNAILIVEFAKDAYARGATLLDATMEAARLRFRPILMTSLAFILGVVPLALATGASAASQRAVGTGVLGGMLAATPFAVVFVPVFFVVVMSIFKTRPRLLGAQAEAAAAEAQIDKEEGNKA
ncbi:multidrug efflux RND transporter permease subunit [Pseudomonas sp. S 311-6]|uniref:Efflux pump membrane transporter n=1 Tax=Kerstersia gyiorum TaxID=206506 RepID=A0A171KSQ5_9BURK|nr:efflux RND transporter permease subunit [Kerstersia gyiorum]MCO7638481.1 multidrug efflux RND transporter permease subunit [Pseudomonas sp. S 311-6]KAB0542052.1 multidrug efflux RND transporter permease subunit [Kerstersia gyiorum]KKO71922.1 acriflavine resistance protein B [Kerstersia gyiorum]MCR4158506.1 multidrug efflux RND transporter permease subunit [Kerstersia gyiorum]QBR41204.1 multidrug efflux RND transporter permease subunit [Kerstersia gyiorum]